MMIINPPVVRYPSYYNCKKSTLVTIISIDLMLIMVTIIIIIIADRQIPKLSIDQSSSSSLLSSSSPLNHFDHIDDLNHFDMNNNSHLYHRNNNDHNHHRILEQNHSITTIDISNDDNNNNDSISDCSNDDNDDVNDDEQQQLYDGDGIGSSLTDKKFALAELIANIIWLLAGMLSLVAVIKEHYHLTIICSLFGAFDVLSAFYFWTKTKSEDNFLQMISSAIYFIFLLLFLSDLAYINKQRLRIARNRYRPPKLIYHI
ncbi:hypothetical protein DERP_012758 [Dermatophagoides pteronyssinus]|uniref:Uncharacterized protein n=1 Tax=Dermatophagoides pteronyssinus TaxID=6956 RepID=A0ABQ8JQ82_DERPT|nr:hypothetical protein DERP_012758 [Dermatophagoides pteronyssinus]